MARLILALVLLPFVIGYGTAVAADRSRGAQEVVTFADPEIIESSGLAVTDGLIATVNDSGDVGRTFVVDRRTGETVGGVTWGEAIDVEALAPTPDGGLLVGDTGGNNVERTSVELIRVPFERGATSGGETRYELSYPDGTYDAEALLVHPIDGRVLLATKGLFAGLLYAAPKPLQKLSPGQSGKWREIGEVDGMVTDGAFFPDGRHFVLRTYTSATIYAYPSLRPVGSFNLPEQEQGEGIAVGPDDALYASTEGQFSSVLKVKVPPKLAQILKPPKPSPAPTPSPSVTAEEPTQAEESVERVEPEHRPLWPWVIGVLVMTVGVAVLLRSLRPR